MSGRYAKFTTDQLNANRKMLGVLRMIVVTLFIVGLTGILIWIVFGKANSSKILALAPVMAGGIAALPIHLQISAIDKELQARSDSAGK